MSSNSTLGSDRIISTGSAISTVFEGAVRPVEFLPLSEFTTAGMPGFRYSNMLS